MTRTYGLAPNALWQTAPSRDLIERVRAANPVEVVVGQYVALHKQGRDWFGRCPFHEDRTPSFSVSPHNQKWFCFGCGVGGDVFKFVQLIEHLSFKKAFGLLKNQNTPTTSIQSFGPPKKYLAKTLTADERQLLTQVAEHYHGTLLKENRALDYLAGRHISLSMIQRHRLGYAQPGDLLRYFPNKVERTRLTALHLLNENGREYFRHRIMIPEWRDDEAIYLVGRATRSTQLAKYLGMLDLAKPLYGATQIMAHDPVILCEGPLDRLTLDEWGYAAVAILGSHLKSNQVAELANAQRVLIAMDSDAAGRQAAARIAAQLGSRACIVPPLPNGVKDVNELAACEDGRIQFAQLFAAVSASV